MLLKRIMLSNYQKNLNSEQRNTIESTIGKKAKYIRVFRKPNLRQNDCYPSPSEIKLKRNYLNKNEIFKYNIFSTMLNESNKIFETIQFDIKNIKLDKEQNKKRFKIINQIKLFLTVNKINFLLCDVIYLFDVLLIKSKKYDSISNMFNYQNLGLGSLILTTKFHNINENNNGNYKKYRSIYDEKYFSLNELKLIELYCLKLLNYNLISPPQSTYIKFIFNYLFKDKKNDLKFVEKILKEIMVKSNEYMEYHPFYLTCFVINYYFDKIKTKDYFNTISYYFEFDKSKYKVLYQKFINTNNDIIDNIYGNKIYSTIKHEKSKDILEHKNNIIQNNTATDENKKMMKFNSINEKILYKSKKIPPILMKLKQDNNNQDFGNNNNTCKHFSKKHFLLKLNNQKIIDNNTENKNSTTAKKLKQIIFNKRNNNDSIRNYRSTDFNNLANNSNSSINNENIKYNNLNLKKQNSLYLPNFPNISYYLRQRAKYSNSNVNSISNLTQENTSKVKDENSKSSTKNSFSNYFILFNPKLTKAEEETEDKNRNDAQEPILQSPHDPNSIRKIYLNHYRNKNSVCKNIFLENDNLRNKITNENHLLVNSSGNLNEYYVNLRDNDKKSHIRKYYKSKKKDNNDNSNNSAERK